MLTARGPLCVDTDSKTVDGRTPGVIEKSDDLLASNLERLPPYDRQPFMEEVVGETGARGGYLELVPTLERQPPLLLPAGPHRASPAGDRKGNYARMRKWTPTTG